MIGGGGRAGERGGRGQGRGTGGDLMSTLAASEHMKVGAGGYLGGLLVQDSHVRHPQGALAKPNMRFGPLVAQTVHCLPSHEDVIPCAHAPILRLQLATLLASGGGVGSVGLSLPLSSSEQQGQKGEGSMAAQVGKEAWEEECVNG